MNCITTGQREQLNKLQIFTAFPKCRVFYLRGGGKLEKWPKAEFKVINTSR